ncbi:hypothetical protein GN956_G4465 [Arapaima gigas]
MSPDMCDLTLIDLPGIARVPVGGQPQDIADKVVVQHLADQVPMLIHYFILKESAKLLCCETLSLMDGANLNDILRKETEISQKRTDLQNRLERLSIAQSKISSFC